MITTILSSMYAVPPCDLPDQKICAYYYKGAMSAEIIVTNMSTETVLVKNLTASLEHQTKSISDLQLAPGQTFTMLKTRFDDHNKQPYYRIGSMQYKILK